MADDFTPDDDFEEDPAQPPAGKVPSPTGWAAPKTEATKGFESAVKGASLTDNPDFWGLASALAHGPAHAMEGPVSGVGAAFKQDLSNLLAGEPLSPKVSPAQAYAKERDRVENEQAPNLQKFPWAPAFGAIVANPGSAPTAAGRLAMGAGQGALFGVGSARGSAKPRDALIGGGIGLGGAAAGELLQLPGRALAKRAQGLSDATHAAELAAEQEARGAAQRSAISSNAGQHSAAMGVIKSMRDAIANPNTDPALKRAAEEFLSSAEGVALHNNALSGNIGQAYGQNARIAASRLAMADAIAANDPAAIKAASEMAAEAKLGDLGGVTSRLTELARRNIPPAVGTALGGPAGTAAGALVAGSMGKPGTIVSNMLRNPSMFRPLVGGATALTGAGGTLTRGLLPLSKAPPEPRATSADPLAPYADLLREKEP